MNNIQYNMRNPLAYYLRLSHLSLLAIWLVGCVSFKGPEEEVDPPSAKPIIESFCLKKAQNPQLKADVVARITADNKIIVSLDYKVDDFTFIPTIIYNYTLKLEPNMLSEINALEKVTYTVSNGKETRRYDVLFDMPGVRMEMVSLSVNGTPAYYNAKEKVFHVPVAQKMWDEPLEVMPEGIGFEEVMINGSKLTDGTLSPLEFGKPHRLTISGDDGSLDYSFILNAMPIMSLRADYDLDEIAENESSDRSPLRISVYDPTKGGKYSMMDHYAGIRMRGASSASAAKKSYAVEFQSEATKEEVEAHLFGLRKDGDWIFDSGSKDPMRMRNRVSTDIWLDLHQLGYASIEPKAKAATRGRMVEAYFNDEYLGIYCVTERIDRKQLNLNEQSGLLIKAEGWDDNVMFNSIDNAKLPHDGDERWAQDHEGFQHEYPKHYPWGAVVDVVRFVAASDEATFESEVSGRFDLTNIADYVLLLAITGATDNSGRNTFLGVYNTDGINPADYRLFYVPWDLDATYGRLPDSQVKLPGYMPGITSGAGAINNLFSRLLQMESPIFRSLLRDRWEATKGDLLAVESIMARVNDYKAQFEKCGAYQREYDKWNGVQHIEPLDEEVAYVETWLQEQWAYIDSWMDNLDADE